MNYEQKLSDTVGPWWKAIAEEPADSKNVEEWKTIADPLLKYASVAGLVLLVLVVGFQSGWAVVAFEDGTLGAQLVGYAVGLTMSVVWVMVFASGILAVKADIAKTKQST